MRWLVFSHGLVGALACFVSQVDGDGHQELLGHDRHCEEGVALDTGPGHADASGGPRALFGGMYGRD